MLLDCLVIFSRGPYLEEGSLRGEIARTYCWISPKAIFLWITLFGYPLKLYCFCVTFFGISTKTTPVLSLTPIDARSHITITMTISSCITIIIINVNVHIIIMFIHIHIYISTTSTSIITISSIDVCMYVCIIYIYIYRERERDVYRLVRVRAALAVEVVHDTAVLNVRTK